MGQFGSPTCRCWILCLEAFITSVGSLYVDAHQLRLVYMASLQYAFKIKYLPKHPTHDVVFHNSKEGRKCFI